MCRLAVLCQRGEGTPKNPAQAVNWYRKAAEGGYAPGQTGLARCLLGGQGVRADPAQAVIWLERAAGQEDPQALTLLGECLRDGRGVPADPARAEECLRRAAALEQKGTGDTPAPAEPRPKKKSFLSRLFGGK